MSTSVSGKDLQIAVAANFRDAAMEIAAAFRQLDRHSLNISSASTAAHYAQIRNGAPYEIFLAADSIHPAKLIDDSLGVAESRMTYAIGRLVLWSRNPELIGPQANVLDALAFRHIAIANPDLAPYGLAAMQTLDHMDVLDKLQDRIVMGQNIGQTFGFVYSRAADLGLVALSQVVKLSIDSGPIGSQWIVPVSHHEPIEQQAIILKDSDAAQEFMRFLRSETARRIIQEHGYTVPSKQ